MYFTTFEDRRCYYNKLQRFGGPPLFAVPNAACSSLNAFLLSQTALDNVIWQYAIFSMSE